MACFLIYLLPFNGHVLADALERKHVLAVLDLGALVDLRFCAGRLFWLPLVIVFSVFAYLTRPEGLILPVALLAHADHDGVRSAGDMPRAKRWCAIGVLVVGPFVAGGPVHDHEGGH